MIETEVTGEIVPSDQREESAGARARLITAPEVARAANTKPTPTPPAATTVPVSAKTVTPADAKSVIGIEATAVTELSVVVVPVAAVVIADDVTSMTDPDETCLRTDPDVVAAIETVVAVTAVIAAIAALTEESNRSEALHLRGRRSPLQI